MKKIAVLLADGFEEIEAVSVIDVMRRLDVEVTVCGIDSEVVIGAHRMIFNADSLIGELNADELDAVYLPGGMPGAVNLLNSSDVNSLLKTMYDAGKIICAICAAPIVLAPLGILEKHRFTMYPGFESYIGDAVSTGNQAELSGNVVTGKGPGAVYDFAAKVAEALGLGAECKTLYQAMFVQ